MEHKEKLFTDFNLLCYLCDLSANGCPHTGKLLGAVKHLFLTDYSGMRWYTF